MASKRFKLEDLADTAGVSIRTVRYYVQRGLLPQPEFRARGTLYDEEHLLRLLAIRHLQARFLPLDAIAGVLGPADRQRLEALAAGADPGLGAPVAPHSPPAGERNQTPGSLPVHSATWQRWELAPGLELHLSDAAAPRVRDLADRLRTLAQQEEVPR
ncbi:MAG: MerR family transcriptional regulator [Candidatus Sericytochromatia bacterium]|nr:MerR family transcriptional regulator [Candidatus Tanganyikabacteria bacterium]